MTNKIFLPSNKSNVQIQPQYQANIFRPRQWVLSLTNHKMSWFWRQWAQWKTVNRFLQILVCSISLFANTDFDALWVICIRFLEDKKWKQLTAEWWFSINQYDLFRKHKLPGSKSWQSFIPFEFGAADSEIHKKSF